MGIYHLGRGHDGVRPGGAGAGPSLPLHAAARSGREDTRTLTPNPRAPVLTLNPSCRP